MIVYIYIYIFFLPIFRKVRPSFFRVLHIRPISAKVTPFKIDRNKNKNRSIYQVQNLGNEKRYIYKDRRQDSGQRNISYTRYPEKCFTQTYRDLYGDLYVSEMYLYGDLYAAAHLDEHQHGGRKPTETPVTEFCYMSQYASRVLRMT